ncbi:MAG: 50S ribosomal protein L11 methyltransferase [Chloroflexi bacterium]|nr:50S ribosomal protein L11 methyltransferase [Chloroflexota bacterium]MCI0579380.1 50S ribosomal protein L11 methyltransferase [Chloroflexota bacterium]MCI0650210.1 50S ribosomal protein L11 methyltransferase [Chloroflexota bacterium]MCI0729479.1 50S ribosomal protein L11 methyltransferase [Chloroflexota bacterium]
MHWLEVSVTTDGEAAEAVSEYLEPFAYGNGVALEQLGDANSPDPDALEPVVTVKIYVPGDEDTPALRRRIEEILYHLGRLYPIPPPTFRELQEEDWANAWKVHYQPFRVGRRLWIEPSWQADSPAAAGDVVIRLDPGMAFGTGLHPTTQMCLQALEEMVWPGAWVLDVGAGSGILAIAAARLGAAKVLALDSDRLAARATVENARQNGVQENIVVFQGTLAAVGLKGWDVVVVNILAPVIESLVAEGLLAYLAADGRLVLSGIIEEQTAGVEAAVIAAGGEIERQLVVRDWVGLVVRGGRGWKPAIAGDRPQPD